MALFVKSLGLYQSDKVLLATPAIDKRHFVLVVREAEQNQNPKPKSTIVVRETMMTASTAPCSLLLACCFMLLVPCHVQATITILETAKSFPSRPEKKLGHQLWKGSEYMGRMQFVHGNLQLCKSAQDPHRRFFISESMDGLPSRFFYLVMAAYLLMLFFRI